MLIKPFIYKKVSLEQPDVTKYFMRILPKKKNGDFGQKYRFNDRIDEKCMLSYKTVVGRVHVLSINVL